MSRRWIPITIVTTILAGLAIAVVATVQTRRMLETPDYTVVSEQIGFEIRRYSPRLVAEVVVGGEADQATDIGFQILADYIAGNNASHTKIDMTTPVDRTAEGNAWVIAFTMPEEYVINNLPTPNDERIEIREVPIETYAVKRFAGAPRAVRVQKRMEEFVKSVELSGFEPTDTPPTFARFDPPWTLPFLRRNEIRVPIVLY